jgi:branched-chain amino acid aminotransferase
VKLFVVASPVGPYYPEGWKPVKLMASENYVRAWPGGTGAAKMGA